MKPPNRLFVPKSHLVVLKASNESKRKPTRVDLYKQERWATDEIGAVEGENQNKNSKTASKAVCVEEKKLTETERLGEERNRILE